MFTKLILDFPTNLFDELVNSTKFESITTARLGANLIDYKNNLIPLVRTTTNYNLPNQSFSPIHYNIIEKISTNYKFDSPEVHTKSECSKLTFNNALIEIYSSGYRTMGFHSDQALDLELNSHICIFSCYNNPDTTNLRKLVVKNKDTLEINTIILDHNSVVIFSVDTNSKHLHKIILEDNNQPDTSWLGITFRQSKTLISFDNGVPYFFPTNTRLALATEFERKEFYKLRGQENASTDFVYPEINYTISNGDLLL